MCMENMLVDNIGRKTDCAACPIELKKECCEIAFGKYNAIKV